MIIYHISDIHIRPNSRICEYEYVFEEFVKVVKGDGNCENKCVVITGDIFHDKTRIDSPGIYLFNKLINDLKPVDIFIIRGNHDYKQWKSDEIDMISSILLTNTSDHVHYLNKTSTYTFGDICFGVLAIQDVLLSGHTNANEKNLNICFPKPRQSCKKKIALFHGKPFFDLCGYDFVLLGDIHQRNIWKNNDTYYAYAGSMIRQNNGESLDKHGFVKWDLETREVSEHDLFNPFQQDKRDICCAFDVIEKTFSIKDVSGCCDENLLLIKEYDIDSVITKKIQDRNHKIKRKIEDFREYVGKFSTNKNIRLLNMKWNWILCYGPNNEFDFTSLDNKVNCINAPNATGKSSLLETIVIALYGTGFPTRTKKEYSVSIINTAKPSGAKCNTSIVLTLNGKMIKITRSFSANDASTLHSISRSTHIEVFVENEGWTFVSHGKTATDNWVDENIGDIRHLSMTYILSQDGDFNFFDMSPIDQKNALDEILCINSYNSLCDLYKESKLAHTYIKDILSSSLASRTSNKPILEKLLTELLEKRDKRKKTINWLPLRLEPKHYYEERLSSYDADISRSLLPYNDKIPPCQYTDDLMEEYKSLLDFKYNNNLPNVFCDNFDMKRYKELFNTFRQLENPITDSGGPFNPRCKCCQKRKESVVDFEKYIEWIKYLNFRKVSISNAIHNNIGNIEDDKYIYDNYESIETDININRIKSQLQNLNDIGFDRQITDDICKKLDIIEKELKRFHEYTSDIYESQIMPYVCKQINSILTNFSIDFKMNSKGFVEWFIKSGSNTTYLNKISGYQKFALNLAIRIVFSRIGQIKLEQMFIDEGFSCCDEKNLSEIPDFLNRLLNIYRSITIVSHLNELKDYFHNKITIRKDVHEGFSVLVKN